VTTVKNIFEKINITGTLRFDEPMSGHTTFRVGGPADVYAEPESAADVGKLIAAARQAHMRTFTLGGGANILVSDRGIRGLVLDMHRFNSLSIHKTQLAVGAGLPVSDAAAYAADNSLSGLHFLYSMPGSVGGAIWMNARCYGSSVSDILLSAHCISSEGSEFHYVPAEEDFDYKRSVFQTNGAIILESVFQLAHGDREELWEAMKSFEADRRAKGHFSAPSAGSIFKNNRAFGKPSGAIIDSLGLRGHAIGGARVSPEHANIIVNSGSATALDIRRLIQYVEEQVETRLGIQLEREVILAGDWTE